jgi:hypothetical protein
MSKQRIMGIPILLLAGASLLFIHSRVAQPSIPSKQVNRLREDVPASLAVASEQRTYTRQSEAPLPFCAPDSFVYLTQAQQEYRLGERGPDSPDVKAAKRNGAEAKISLRVVDSRGIPVSGADILVAFVHRGQHPVRGKSDAIGFFTASHLSESDAHFHVSKEGYYKTFRNYWFYREGKPCAKDGRWIPWNPTLEAVLKEKRKPTDLVSVPSIKILLPKGIRVGFDCKEQALVAPYGTGAVSDFFLTYTSNGRERSNLGKNLVLSFNEGCGAIVLRKDVYSRFVSLHEAPETGYLREISLSFKRTPTTIEKNTRIADDSYLVIRSRYETSADGKTLSSLYSKFYKFVFDESADGKTGYMLFQYYYNPVNNDRNLEGTDIYP